MKKRLLSIILAITVIATLVPAMTLSAGAENTMETEYVYFLGEEGVMNPMGEAKYSVLKVDYSMSGNKWKYKSSGSLSYGQLLSGRINVTGKDANVWLALEFYVPDGNWTGVKYSSYRISNNGGKGNVYILPQNADLTDIGKAITADGVITVAENVDYSDATNGSVVAEASVEADISEGRYILLFKLASQGSVNNVNSMYPASFTLIGTGSAATSEYSDYNFKYQFAGEIEAGTDVTEVTYADTRATWAYDSLSGVASVKKMGEYTNSHGIEIVSGKENSWVAFRLNIPAAGKYRASYLYNRRWVYGGYGDIYLLPGDTIDIKSALSEDNKLNTEEICYYGEGTHERELLATLRDVDIEKAGEYILVFYGAKKGPGYRQGQMIGNTGNVASGGENAAYYQYPQGFFLAGKSTGKAYSGVITVPAELENGTIVENAVKVWDNQKGTEITTNITLTSSDTEVATVDGTTVTAVAAGDTTLTATVSKGYAAGNIIGADVTVVPTAQEKADAAFITDDNKTENTSYTASDLKGLTVDGDVINGVPNGDGSYNLTAPEKNKAGYKFIYWAKGNVAKKRILLSQTNELKNYVPDENGVTYLIPVYEDMLPETAEYYNANGQLIPDATSSDTAYMAGYGETSEWQQYGDTNIYVAKYNKETPDPVTVKVVDGTGTDTVPYGDPITCTADEATHGTFRWWQKDVNGTQEIVSVDKEYSFLAYENCTVTAVYGDSEITVTDPAKIIIDTFGENSIMAEFIGFKNKTVLEKGIMFGENRIAMTAPGNQFTVTADKNGTFKGYAVVEDGDSYTLITDGEVTINNLAE